MAPPKNEDKTKGKGKNDKKEAGKLISGYSSVLWEIIRWIRLGLDENF
jgi:hypothetical protein